MALGGDYTTLPLVVGPAALIASIVEKVSSSALGLGTPALVTRGVNPPRLDIFFRGWDRAVYHMTSNGFAPWRLERLGGVILDFPVRSDHGEKYAAALCPRTKQSTL